MNDTIRNRYEMFMRVDDFGTKYTAPFPEGSLGRQYFIDLAAIIAEIQQKAAAQQSSERAVREGTTLRKASRTRLRKGVDAISETARAIAIETPGTEDKFRIPGGTVNDVDLINIARGFAADALPLKDQFIAHGLPASFLDDLDADIAAFEQAIDEQQRSKREQAAATAGLDDAVKRGVNKVRQLDAIVRNKFRDNPAILAEWETARHTRRARASAPEAPPDTTPQTK